MHRSISLCLLLCALAPVAHASTQTILQDDAAMWKSTVQQESALDQGAVADMQWQESNELFPVVEQLPETEQPLITFRDVPPQSWFAPFVRTLVEDGVLTGYRDAAGQLTGLFGPADSVTVEQMAKIAVHVSGGIGADCGANPFNQSASGSWSVQYIACAESRGWAVFSDGSVDVRTPATRGQVIVTMLQAFAIAWGDRTGTAFSDVTMSTEFGAAIERAKADGLVSGYADAQGNPTGTFGPQANVTRAEMAKIAVHAREIYGQ